VARSRDDLRQSVWNLRQDSDAAGTDLVEELRDLVRGLPATDALQVEVVPLGMSRTVPASTAHHIGRIAQEALHNALRHAAARNIRIECTFEEGRLLLTVRDDGIGYDPGRAPGADAGHFGIAGMHERARRLGGRLSFGNKAGRGTQVTLEVPTP